MRKVGIALLVVAITAGAVYGVIQTGFFQKAIWVFQGVPLTGPGGNGLADGHGFQGGGKEGQRPRDGQGPEGRGVKGGAPDRGQPSGGLSLTKVGWFALIMAFFAMVTILLDRGWRAVVARRRR